MYTDHEKLSAGEAARTVAQYRGIKANPPDTQWLTRNPGEWDMRIAYIGLSSPIMYDYKTEFSRAPADEFSSPNPILDCPTGLMLLFDELWFLTRSLCPWNLRQALWVKFLDEKNMLPDLSDITATTFSDSWQRRPDLRERYDKVLEAYAFDQLRGELGISWERGQDNHTHNLNIAGLKTRGGWGNVDNLLMDLEILKRLDDSRVELVSNRVSQNWLEVTNPLLAESALAQILVIDRIPTHGSLKF